MWPRRWRSNHPLWNLLRLSLVAFFAIAPFTATAQTTSTYGNQIKPSLQIPIPTLPAFSNITITGTGDDAVRTINVPFLAEYITAIYKYATGIAGLVATVMIMIGGIQYLIARGDQGKVTKAKERITNAVMGLVLVLGAFLILNTVNPALTQQDAFNLQIVQGVDFNEVLATTDVATSESPYGDSSASGGGGGVSAPATGGGGTTPSPSPGSAAAGSFTPTITSCPFILANPKNKLDFIQQVQASTALRGSTPRDRASKIAQAALACGAYLGSCGNTAQTIQALAGIGSQTCITAPLPTIGCARSQGRLRYGLSGKQRAQLYGLRCGSEKGYGDKYRRTDCVNTSAEAVKKIRDFLKAEAAAGNMPGWPDTWANSLQPGDHVVYYNGNTDLVGAHAVIFMGWGSGGRMQVIQGTAGRATFTGGACIKSECGDSMTPLLYIYSAE